MTYAQHTTLLKRLLVEVAAAIEARRYKEAHNTATAILLQAVRLCEVCKAQAEIESTEVKIQ